MTFRRTILLFEACTALTLCGVGREALADGPFDPTFAGNGLFPYSYWFHPDSGMSAGLALDSESRLIVATSVGNHLDGKFGIGATRHISETAESLILPPFFADGLPDETFGTDGIADFFNADNNGYVTGVAVDHRDRIVVGGSAQGIATCSDGSTKEVTADVLIRLRNDKGFDGQFDSNFGTFGVAILGDCSQGTQGIAALAVDANDNIVATGSISSVSHNDTSLIRWTSKGVLDTSFGVDGQTTIKFGDSDSYGSAVAIDHEGRILVAGSAIQTDGTIVGLLSRYDTNGTLDTTFGASGFAELGKIGAAELGYYAYTCCVAIDSKNRAVVAGTRVESLAPDSAEESAFAARFTPSGMPDTTFGNHGFVYFSSNQISDGDVLAVDNKDRPIIGGSSWPTYGPNRVIALTHLNLDGTVNAAVGFDGTYTASFGFSSPYVTSALIDHQGRPTLSANGYDSDGRSPVPVLIRYDELYGDGFD